MRITKNLKEILSTLYNKKKSLFYLLFIDEFRSSPVVVDEELYRKLSLNILEKAGLLYIKRYNNYFLCHGRGQFFPIDIKNNIVFIFTDWSNPDMKGIGDSKLGEMKGILSENLVFPTYKFKEQFYYHVFRTNIEIERLLSTQEEISILDFGTGSGAYLLYLSSRFSDGRVKFYGTEINRRAYDFCKFNIKLNGLESSIKISKIDILSASEEEIRKKFKVDKFDIIVANPPYVPTPKEIEKEYPKWGKAGEDGLALSLGIIKKSNKLLKKNGKILTVAYSLGDEEIPIDIINRIGKLQSENLTFFVSHVYPPVWIGFNPLWRQENPIPLERVVVRFRRSSEEGGVEGKSETVEYWFQKLQRQGKIYLHHLFIEGRNNEKKRKGKIFFFRRLKLKDLPQMIKCEEESWHTSMQATSEKLMMRLNVFPEGVWGSFIKEESSLKSKLIGFGTSQIVEYFITGKGKGWNEMTMYGDISKTHNPSGNTLHLVSGSVIPKYRGYGIWRNLIILRMIEAYFRKSRYLILHSRVPYYKEKGKGISAEKYAPTDPYIKVFSGLGFEMEDVIEECEDDPGSNNYCVLMFRKVKYGI